MKTESRILYLAGWGRSGSTLIARALGGIDGWCTVGEARRVWDFGVIRNEACSCGAPFHDCPFWSDIFQRAFDGMDSAMATRMVQAQSRIHTWQMAMLPRSRLLSMTSGWDGEFLSVLRRLYDAVAEVTGARVIVDSSKIPAYGLALDAISEGSLRVAHLVRDPRACTYSWAKRRKRQPFGVMKSVGPIGNGLQWASRNRAITRAWGGDPDRYLLFRYEDFIADPTATLAVLAGLTGDARARFDHVAESNVILGPSHMAAGNPNRFSLGPTTLRLDDEWETALPGSDRRLVEALARGQMRRYGYERGSPVSLRPT